MVLPLYDTVTVFVPAVAELKPLTVKPVVTVSVVLLLYLTLMVRPEVSSDSPVM